MLRMEDVGIVRRDVRRSVLASTREFLFIYYLMFRTDFTCRGFAGGAYGYGMSIRPHTSFQSFILIEDFIS